jgi:hypothetical protein
MNKLIEFDKRIQEWIEKHRTTYWVLLVALSYFLSFLYVLSLGNPDAPTIFLIGTVYSVILISVDLLRWGGDKK